MKNITYNYFNWGPFLYQTNVGEETVKKILSLCKRDKSKDMRERLAGHLSEEYELKTEDVMQFLGVYFKSYQQAANHHYNLNFTKPIKMKTAWVNYMKESEFNPPHDHSGDLSCVLYLKVPKDIEQNNKNHISNSPNPGCLYFKYGERLKFNLHETYIIPKVGDFYIFPAWLNHTVFPFKSKEERISLAANLIEID